MRKGGEKMDYTQVAKDVLQHVGGKETLRTLSTAQQDFASH